MRFEARLRAGIERGTIVLAFRRWKRSQVVAGHRYRTGTGLVEVDAIDVVSLADIDQAQAGEAAGAGGGAARVGRGGAVGGLCLPPARRPSGPVLLVAWGGAGRGPAGLNAARAPSKAPRPAGRPHGRIRR